MLVAVNKRARVAGGLCAATAACPFSRLDQDLFRGIAAHLGGVLHLSVRHAVLQLEQDAQVATMTHIASVMAGLRPLNCALQSTCPGSAWGVVERHAARLVQSQRATLTVSDGHGGGVHRLAAAGWRAQTVEVPSHVAEPVQTAPCQMQSLCSAGAQCAVVCEQTQYPCFAV